jgi:hypothetical protein
MAIPKAYVGKWRIIEMDQWDQDYIDTDVPGHITVGRDGRGSFQFGVVQGVMDCRLDHIGDLDVLGFSWEGSDDCDPAFGRGWAVVEGKQLTGQIFLHEGDASGFKAKKGR